jgi:spore coat polysaccharide biosynthesis protein SpsF
MTMEAQRTTVAVIDLCARQRGSSPGTAFDLATRQFHGLSLLERCARRLSDTTTVDQIVITGLPSHRSQLESASLCGAKWIPSKFDEPFQRLQDIAEKTKAGWLVLVSPTFPFLDPTLLDRLVTSAWASPEADYVGFMAAKHPRFDLAKLGLVAEVCTRRSLSVIASKKLQLPGVDVPHLLRAHPNVFHMRFVPLPEALDRTDLHFTFETAEDWENASSYLEAGGEEISWQRLVELSATRE